MEKTIDLLGNVVGIIGVLLCLIAGVTRVLGSHYLVGFESVTLFIGGISFMVAACLAKLQHISVQLNR